MKSYLTRICWNNNGWTRPAGVAPRAEGPIRGSGPTFVSEYGYGHEEWLFRLEHRFGDWQYGFVQPALKVTEDRYGEVLDAVLYTIAPDRDRYYLGRINGLEILGLPEAAAARDRFIAAGLARLMAEDLDALELTKKNLQIGRERSREFVNVRFRADAVQMLPEPVRASSDDVTQQRGKNRYQFYPLDTSPPALSGTSADPNRPTDAYKYRTAPVVHADRRHNRIQVRLVELLRAKYGSTSVAMEVDGVDILLTVNAAPTLVEVKSDGDARLAIRAAIGQLLEYALFARSRTVLPALVVAAPGTLDAEANAYLAELRSRFSLPLSYVQVDEATTVCPL